VFLSAIHTTLIFNRDNKEENGNGKRKDRKELQINRKQYLNMRALMKSEKARKIIRRTSTNIIPQIPPFTGARFQIDGFSKGQKL
jgi:hypothetical protein